ncbi:MAG: glycosyltransferase family 2 protein [Pseudomonadota bacterium]
MTAFRLPEPQRDNPITSMNPTVDIVVPAFQERDNIKALAERIASVREATGYDIHVYVVDDDSQDGTEQAVDELDLGWFSLIVRKDERGLSSAVLRGMDEGEGDILLCMDADLSHPPEAIPAMVSELNAGADFVVGSRYVEGGSTDDNWGLYRWLNSRIATLLARPFVNILDPMSGFFALFRSQYDQATQLNPIGYKIGLELIVKCGCRKVVEVPIHFTDRVRGESKLTMSEQLKYIQHIRRLFLYQYATSSELIQFLVVGGSGTIINLSVLTILLWLSVPSAAAIAGGIAVSVISNFVLHRRFTFSHSRTQPVISQFLRYLLSVAAGIVVNYSVALTLITVYEQLAEQLAAAMGIAAAMTFNFLAMKFLVFKRKFYKRS